MLFKSLLTDFMVVVGMVTRFRDFNALERKYERHRDLVLSGRISIAVYGDVLGRMG